MAALHPPALPKILPADDTYDVIRHSGQEVTVTVPIEEYQQLRQAMQEQQVNEEPDAARAGYLARRALYVFGPEDGSLDRAILA